MSNDLSLDIYLWSIKLHRGHLQFLRYFKEGVQHFLPARHKFLTDLNNAGLIYENNLTTKGKDLYEECINWTGEYVNNAEPKKVERVYSEDFLRFWNAYPASDNFTIEGVDFSGTRVLRKDRDKVSTKYEQIIKIIEPEHLLAALQWEIDFRKDESLKKRQNQLSFLSAIDVYLNQKKFEIHLGKGPYKEKSTFKNTETVI